MLIAAGALLGVAAVAIDCVPTPGSRLAAVASALVAVSAFVHQYGTLRGAMIAPAVGMVAPSFLVLVLAPRPARALPVALGTGVLGLSSLALAVLSP